MPELADPSLMRTQAFVAGEWRDADETIPIVDPGKNEPFTEVASCTAAEAEEAIDAAEKVLPEWQEKTAEDRCAILAELHQLMRQRVRVREPRQPPAVLLADALGEEVLGGEARLVRELVEHGAALGRAFKVDDVLAKP